MTWDMWEHQNGALHKSQDAQQIIVESCMNDAIQALYAKGSWILRRDAMHFMHSWLITSWYCP